MHTIEHIRFQQSLPPAVRAGYLFGDDPGGDVERVEVVEAGIPVLMGARMLIGPVGRNLARRLASRFSWLPGASGRGPGTPVARRTVTRPAVSTPSNPGRGFTGPVVAGAGGYALGRWGDDLPGTIGDLADVPADLLKLAAIAAGGYVAFQVLR